MHRLVYIALSLLILSSCSGCREEKGHVQLSPKELEEKLLEENKNYLDRESTSIDKYIKENKLVMERTGTGLRHSIESSGQGKNAESGMRAFIYYKKNLLDGTLISSVQSGDPVSFMISEDNVESGVHEGVLLMQEGDKATFILPSHLAYGLTGEGKVPPGASLVYEIELLKLQ